MQIERVGTAFGSLQVKFLSNLFSSFAQNLLSSNGCGRSGAFVCLDANLQLADEEGVVDIFNYAKKLRKSRHDMIENLVSNQ